MSFKKIEETHMQIRFIRDISPIFFFFFKIFDSAREEKLM